MTKVQLIAYISIVVPAILAINYLLALAGSPQSLWFMKLIGMMP